jgi:hypothetical protein
MDRLENIMDEASKTIPDGYGIGLCSRKGFYGVIVVFPDGSLEVFSDGSMARRAHCALRRAISHAESANMEANEKACADKCRDQAMREDDYERKRRDDEL